MSRKTLLSALALLAIGAGCAQQPAPANVGNEPQNAVIAPVEPPAGGPPSAAPAPAPAPRTATITLKAVGDWKQTGTATLTDLPGNETRIDIRLSGPNPDVAQPAAIYAGSCATLSAEVQYPLAPVVNGRSSTVLDVNIGALIDKTPQAIKIKRDPVDAKLPYANCGELK